MTDTAKPTPGPYEIRGQRLQQLYSKSARVEILTADQVSTCSVDGHYYSVKDDEANKNIHLAKDAFEVLQETGLTPRQLLERVRELEGAMNRILCQSHADECCGEYKLNHDGIPDCCGRPINGFDRMKEIARAALAKHGEAV